MKIRTKYRQAIVATVFLMAASPLSMVQAADNYYSGQAAQPAVNPGYQGNAPQYGYPQPYYGGRNYRRGSNFTPWGGDGPSFSGPWDSGRGNSMPWNSGRGPSFSGPWDGGRGNSMPWNSGRGGSGPSFSGPWNSGRGNSMSW